MVDSPHQLVYMCIYIFYRQVKFNNITLLQANLNFEIKDKNRLFRYIEVF